MKKIKVCFITTLPYTIRWFLLDTIAYLKEKEDWDITVVCTNTDGFEEELPDGVKYAPITMKRGFSLSGVKSTVELIHFFRTNKFDMVQYATSNAGCYASIAAFITRVPVRIYTQWGIDYIYFSGLKRIIYEAIERTICSLSTTVQPDSFFSYNISVKEKLYSQSKGEVIWNGSAQGVNLEKFNINNKDTWRREIRERLGIDSECFVFGYVGRLLAQKGINEFFLAAKAILEHENVRILIVGPLDRTDGLENNLFEWAKKEEKIIFTGYTNVAEQFYAAMDCFVFPSYREGFGSAVIEAEALALPVIASNIPGPQESVIDGKTGILIEKENFVALEKAMETILSNSDLAKELGLNGYNNVREKYDQSVLLEKIRENRIRIIGEKIQVNMTSADMS